MVRISDGAPPRASSQETDVLDTYAAGGLVIRGAAYRLIAYVAGTVLTVGSAVLLTRHLGVTRFGQYTTVISVVTVAGALTDLGVTALATREYAVRAGEERERLLRDVLGVRIAIAVVAIALATIFAVAAGYDSERIAGTVVAAVGLGLVSLQATVAVPLFATLRLGQTSALELLRQVVWVGLLAILVALGAGLLPLLAVTGTSFVSLQKGSRSYLRPCSSRASRCRCARRYGRRRGPGCCGIR